MHDLTHDVARPWTPGTTIPGLRSFGYGGDYNPQGWSADILAEDIELMHEAGVTIVTLGVFAWCLEEPREGLYDFAFLDENIARLHEAGIAVDLATPTAAPPAWFWQAHPEARAVDREGRTLGTASRGIGCPSSGAYRAASQGIARALSARYGHHPAVRMWHVHNEYGVPVFECYCPTSVASFRVWLQRRYGDLEALNAAWGTLFWGQVYSAWEQIDAPRRSATAVNPAQQLDFQRFCNDELLECYRIERDAIREHSQAPITTNFMTANAQTPNYWDWAREVDVVANDHYLRAESPRRHVDLALSADLTRSYADGRAWVLMEHSTSAVNWQPRNIAKQPGEMTRNSLQHLARGADAVLFFQFRAQPYGAEKFHSTMVPAAGARTRVFREVCELGSILAGLDELLGSRVRARVAILWDPESFWAQDLEWRPSVDLRHRERIEAWYSVLFDMGITTDFAHPAHELRGYDVVLMPASYLISDVARDNLERYVAEGGRLVVGCFSGVVDEAERLPAGAMPGQLRRLLGMYVEELKPLSEDEIVRLSDGVIGRFWSEDVVLDGARALATFVDGPAAGGAALTEVDHGRGRAWYLATAPTGAALRQVLEPILADAGLVADPDAGNDLEHVIRWGADKAFDVWINHSGADRAVGVGGTDLVSEAVVTAPVTVPAGGVRIIRRES